MNTVNHRHIRQVQQSPQDQGPPYAPTNASLGGSPTLSLDVPITAVFLFLFICSAIAHMTIFQLNRRRSHKFIMSGLMFGFCMARITTCIMRIVWACRLDNVRIAIAASILVAAGVVLLFVINLIFAQRILRASHPHSAWHPLFSKAFILIYVVIVISLFLLIAFVVQSFYTIDPNWHRIDRDVQLYGGTYFAFVAILPIFLVLGGLIIPRKTRVEKFGVGRFRSKIYILLSASALLALGAWFRVGIQYMDPRSSENPAPYQSKACFYIFNFTIEIVVIWLYIIVRVDRRFYVPNGSKGPGDYSGKNAQKIGEAISVRRVMTEEEVFDDVPTRIGDDHADIEHGLRKETNI